MYNWAWKSLISQKGNLLGSAFGIASTFILVIFFDAVFRGESTQIIAYPDNIKPDVWVMQRGVSNMHMAMSFVWDWKAEQIAKMPEVKRVTPILYLMSVANTGGQESFSFIVGLLPDAQRAGPWKMAAGRHIKDRGEAVIPDTLSKLTGIGIGDQFKITDKTFIVVGLSSGTYSTANSIIFTDFYDLEGILSSTGTYSYLLVDAKEGVNAKTLADKIKNEVEKVNALPHEEFIVNDFALAMQMGVEIIFIMTVICSVLAALIVGFTSYSIVMRRRRELAIIKALGMHKLSILGSVVFQAGLLTFLAYIIAVLFSVLVIPQIPVLVPQLTLVVSIDIMIRIGIIALFVTIFGALLPAYLVSRVDPATAFHV